MPDLEDISALQDADALAAQATQAKQSEDEILAARAGQRAAEKPDVNLDGSAETALDKHLEELGETPEPEKLLEGDPRLKEQKPAEVVTDDDKKAPAPDKVATNDDKLDSLFDVKPGIPAKPEDKPAEAKSEDDPYEAHKVRADASEKTKETVANLKRLAKEREAAATQRAIAAEERAKVAEAKAAELASKTSELPAEVKAELESLRAHRATFDVQNDPAFKAKYVEREAQNYQAIYDRLTANKFPDAELEKLKAFSKADRDAFIDSVLDKMPVADRRIVEAKLVANLSLSEERNAALKEAAAKAESLLKEQQEAPVKTKQAQQAAVVGVLKPLLPNFPFLHLKEISPSALPEDRKKLEAENTYATQLQQHLASAITDESPQKRAEAALAVPLAHHYIRQTRALEAQVASLTKELDGIRKASSTSKLARREGQASAAAKSAPKVDVNQSTGDALDELLKSVQEGAA
jgi:hypothetical protein